MATYDSYKKLTQDSFNTGAVDNADIAANTVTAAKIAPGAVGTSQLIANSVTTGKIANSAVGTTQLANTIDLSGRTVTYRSIATADISASSAIATSKLSGPVVVSTGNPTMTGGAQWFSPGYFGVEVAYTYTNGTTLQTLEYKRLDTNASSFWILAVTKSGSTYTVVYGARIDTPRGGTTGDQLSFTLANSSAIVGSANIPASGTYYLAWLSGNGGSGNPSPAGSIYNDTGGSSGGTVEYVNTNVTPTNGGTYTTTSGATGANMKFRVRASYTALTGLAASALVDGTNADNINQGRLAFARGGQGTEGGIHVEENGQKTGGSWQTLNWRVSGGARNQFILNNSGTTFAFDGTTFTTYQPGTYIMLAEIITYQSTGQIDMAFVKNGSYICDFRGGSDIGNHAAVSGRITINLAANDAVKIDANGDNGIHEDYYTQWSVTKLGGWS
jgi:hypothetical protein